MMAARQIGKICIQHFLKGVSSIRALQQTAQNIEHVGLPCDLISDPDTLDGWMMNG